LLTRLGVQRRGVGEDVDLDDQAPLAAIRQAIVHPPSLVSEARQSGPGKVSYP
jgi:hypothetical protein